MGSWVCEWGFFLTHGDRKSFVMGGSCAAVQMRCMRHIRGGSHRVCRDGPGGLWGGVGWGVNGPHAQRAFAVVPSRRAWCVVGSAGVFGWGVGPVRCGTVAASLVRMRTGKCQASDFLTLCGFLWS